MLQTFLGPHRYLRRQGIVTRIHGSTDDGRELGRYHDLAADDDENSRALRISAGRVANSIKVATLQTGT